jgi:hypothetical protein
MSEIVRRGRREVARRPAKPPMLHAPDGIDRLPPLVGSHAYLDRKLAIYRAAGILHHVSSRQVIANRPGEFVQHVWVFESDRRAEPESGRAKASTMEVVCVTAVALVLAGGLVTALVIVAAAIGAHIQAIAALIALVLIVGVVGAVKVLPAWFRR